ncbi:melanoma-associated antigen E1-like [Thunnus maccoyii]|uniref:melanoma-associated antigen E1-like n=1 Tax=Thunnus maccoyii TaxID=8240 RepID=UPI001C4B5ADA|nr:melanoma-associated antigen E1-like [Thunnus maccoyii]
MPGSTKKLCLGCNAQIGVACKKCPQCALMQPHKKRLTDAWMKFSQEKDAWRSKYKKWNNGNKEHEKAYKLLDRFSILGYHPVLLLVCWKRNKKARPPETSTFLDASTSLRPSTLPGPSTSPGLSTSPRRSTSLGPSVSLGPSTSPGPSVSLGPSTSSGPSVSLGPSTSSGPSVLLGLSTSPRPSTSPGPSVSLGPSTNI